MVTETFFMVPAGPKPALVLLPFLLLLVGVLMVLGFAIRSSRSATFELSATGLRLRGEPIYRSRVPASALRGQAARLVDLRQERALAPVARTAGTALPGYRSGWFRLGNGDKALLYLTDQSRVVYVPTTDHYALLLSVAEPERFLTRLREIAPRP